MASTDPVELAQETLREGPIVVLGSGVSIGISASLGIENGFPSMSQLGERLIGSHADPPGDSGLREAWSQARAAFETGRDFEKALDQVSSTGNELRAWAAGRIAQEVGEPDDAVREHLVGVAGEPRGPRHQAFGLAQLLFRLFNGLDARWPVLTVVTTNYDHLVEMACDLERIRCHTGFVGDRLRWFEREPALWGTARWEQDRGRVRYLPHVRLCKPHGSLGWFNVGGQDRQIVGNCGHGKPLMVPPGPGKANQVASDTVLDDHRSWAKTAFRRAKTVVIFGYGFNDEYLETELRQRLCDGMPALLLTKKTTHQAKELIDKAPRLVVGEATPEAPDRTTWTWNDKGTRQVVQRPGKAWDLTTFVQRIW